MCSREDLLWATEEVCSTKLEKDIALKLQGHVGMEWGQKGSQSTYGLQKVSGCFVICEAESRVLGSAASAPAGHFQGAQRVSRDEVWVGRDRAKPRLWGTQALLALLWRQRLREYNKYTLVPPHEPGGVHFPRDVPLVLPTGLLWSLSQWESRDLLFLKEICPPDLRLCPFGQHSLWNSACLSNCNHMWNQRARDGWMCFLNYIIFDLA